MARNRNLLELYGMDDASSEREECAYIDAVFKACPNADQDMIVDLMEKGDTVKEAIAQIKAELSA